MAKKPDPDACLIAECPSCKGVIGAVLQICTNAERIANAWEQDGLTVAAESVSKLQLFHKGHAPGCRRGERINAEWKAKLAASPTRNRIPVEAFGDLPDRGAFDGGGLSCWGVGKLVIPSGSLPGDRWFESSRPDWFVGDTE